MIYDKNADSPAFCEAGYQLPSGAATQCLYLIPFLSKSAARFAGPGEASSTLRFSQAPGAKK